MTTQGPEGPEHGLGGEAAGQPTEEEMQAVLEEQMRRLTVSDVIVQTVVTLINLGARKLGLTQGEGTAAGERDLEQARLAIEATRALIPLMPAEVAQIREALSQLQMAYAREAGGGGAPEPEGQPAEPAGGATKQSGPGAAEEAERARARAKIWTPGS